MTDINQFFAGPVKRRGIFEYSSLVTGGAAMSLIFLASIGKIVEEEVYFGTVKSGYKCFFKSNFGITCPSCGLTRGWICIADADLETAATYNANSISTFFACLFVGIAFIAIGLYPKRILQYLLLLISVGAFYFGFSNLISENLSFYKTIGFSVFWFM